MIDDNKLIWVRNRANGSVGYKLDNNFHRTFEYKERKQVPFRELRELQYAPGGQYALDNLLVIEDEEALKYLNMKVEPEYFYTEENIKTLLYDGTIEEFADFLDFAPQGALELAKAMAIREELPDMRKRQMLSEKTGVNINNAIMINHVMNDDDNENAGDETPKQRRVQVKEEKSETESGRRAALPQYKVVSK